MDKGFSSRQDEELEATELRLGLPGTDRPPQKPPTVPICGGATGGKRALVDESEERTNPSKPTKSQVVGWPPVRSSFRRNVLDSTKKTEPQAETKQSTASASTAAAAHFIKVSMDGAPFLRKVDLNVLKGYKDLRLALDAMFKCFDTTTSDLSVTYEDKDGDWMLVGDVPWEMFTDSCRRLRIMKGSDARGLNLVQ